MLKHKIQICFSRPQNRRFIFASWLIRAIEKVAFSHVYAKFSFKKEPFLYHSYWPSGVILHPEQEIEKYLYVTDIYETTVNDAEYKMLVEYCERYVGTPYSVLQLVGILIMHTFRINRYKKDNPLADQKRKMVCTEAIAYLLQDVFQMKFSQSFDVIGLKDIKNTLKQSPIFKKVQ